MYILPMVVNYVILSIGLELELYSGTLGHFQVNLCHVKFDSWEKCSSIFYL